MKISFTSILLLLGIITVRAQTDSVAIKVDSCQCGKSEMILDFVEEMPAPGMGWDAWPAYVRSQLKVADSTLKKNPGTVYIGLVVDVNGKVCSSMIRKGSKVAPELDEEMLRIVRESGAWNPGRMNGRAVCVRINIPMRIEIQ